MSGEDQFKKALERTARSLGFVELRLISLEKIAGEPAILETLDGAKFEIYDEVEGWTAQDASKYLTLAKGAAKEAAGE